MVSEIIKQRLKFIDNTIEIAYRDPLQYALRSSVDYSDRRNHEFLLYGE